jgi:hypothetical protein
VAAVRGYLGLLQMTGHGGHRARPPCLWTEALARVADAFGRRARELGLGEKHLWMTGTASAVAREQFQQQGWTLHEQSETQLWARR